MSFREEVEAINARFLDAFNSGDAAACADCYTEDVIYLAAGKEPLRGRAAVKALITEELGAGYKMESFTAIKTEADEKLGYGIVRYVANAVSGIVMMALRRDERGIWRVCVEAPI